MGKPDQKGNKKNYVIIKNQEQLPSDKSSPPKPNIFNFLSKLMTSVAGVFTKC